MQRLTLAASATRSFSKTFLSAAFTYAKRMWVLDGVNPVQGTAVPKGTPTAPTCAYSPKEINELVAVLGGTARTAVIVAAYTGLSLAELKGLQWVDIADGQLVVKRTFWHGTEGRQKLKREMRQCRCCPWSPRRWLRIGSRTPERCGYLKVPWADHTTLLRLAQNVSSPL